MAAAAAMAPVLLLLVVVLLQQLPASAPATLNSNPLQIGDLSPPAAAPSSKEEVAEIEKEKEAAAKAGLVSFTNGTGSYKGMGREFLEGHNTVRRRFGVPEMKWNKKLARYARRWANAMRKDCQSMHSSGSNYGENVYVSHDTWNATAKDAVWTWSHEEPLYDKRTGNCIPGHHYRECGHFINMVTEKTQKLGCARAECYQGGVFMSCNYYLRDNDP